MVKLVKVNDGEEDINALLLFLVALLCACCGKAPSATPWVSPAPSLTLIPATPMPTLTPTPTPTLTPTPTAVPIVVHPNPRAAGSSMPGAQPGAPCGLADWLDFPIDPPDAAHTWIPTGYGGGTDGYSGLHAGDDWLMYKRQTLGVPVYSIGKGQVTYAEPFGWGADKGTVIVRHTFADGESVLSFYGHLDPASVTRAVGACVARGDKVGAIGKPRSPAHLHFEIRTHMPDQPGPGYWPSDPTVAGWLPPSKYIIYRREISAPGMRWIRPLFATGARFAGQIDATTFAAVENGALVGIDKSSGETRWRRELVGTIEAVRLNVDRSLIFVASALGDLEAWRPAKEGMAPELAWTARADIWGTPQLLPLAGGGVVILAHSPLAGQARMLAISSEGTVLWSRDMPVPARWWLTDELWAVGAGELLVSDVGGAGAWTLDDSGARPWGTALSGRAVISGDARSVYARDGVYSLEADAASASLLYLLPSGDLSLGDMLALPDGSLLLARGDPGDGRLIVLNPDGSVHWQRSYASQAPGRPQLFLAGERPYLLVSDTTPADPLTHIAMRVSMYVVDLEREELTEVFSLSGVNAVSSEDVEIAALDDGTLLLSVAGSPIVAIE